MTNPPRRMISSGRAPRATSRRSALRGALAAVGGLSLAGCDRLSQNTEFVDVLKSAQDLSHAAHRLVAGRKAMAQEFAPADVAAHFKAQFSCIARRRFEKMCSTDMTRSVQ